MAKSGKYFSSVDRDGNAIGVWHFDGHVAVRVGIPRPMSHESSHVVVNSEPNLFQIIGEKQAKIYPDRAPFSFENMELAPGQYCPRMSRVIDQHVGSPNAVHHCPGTGTLESQIAIMRGQLVSLMHKMIEICRTVHPSESTFGTYGHEIRNLLILACTEVETHWRGVIEANGRSGKFATRDHVILQEAMRLSDYGVALMHYPRLPILKPFEGWNINKPTESLPWYRAYNNVKHDREKNFAEGNLLHAMNAVSACAVMLVAQFGEHEAFRWRSEFGVRKFF